MPLRLRRHHRLVNVGAAVAHIDPATPLRRPTRRLDTAQPQLRFAIPAFALRRMLVFGRLLANVPLLVRQAQHLPRLGHHRQTVVLQEAAALAVADRTGSFQGRMLGEIHLRGVVQDQHQRLLSHLLPRPLPVRTLDRWQGGGLLMAESIKAPQVVPVENLIKRLLGMGRDLGRRVNQAPGPPLIAEFDRAEVFCDHAKQEQASMTPSLLHKWHPFQNIDRFISSCDVGNR